MCELLCQACYVLFVFIIAAIPPGALLAPGAVYLARARHDARSPLVSIYTTKINDWDSSLSTAFISPPLDVSAIVTVSSKNNTFRHVEVLVPGSSINPFGPIDPPDNSDGEALPTQRTYAFYATPASTLLSVPFVLEADTLMTLSIVIWGRGRDNLTNLLELRSAPLFKYAIYKVYCDGPCMCQLGGGLLPGYSSQSSIAECGISYRPIGACVAVDVGRDRGDVTASDPSGCSLSNGVTYSLLGRPKYTDVIYDATNSPPTAAGTLLPFSVMVRVANWYSRSESHSMSTVYALPPRFAPVTTPWFSFCVFPVERLPFLLASMSILGLDLVVHLVE